MDHIETVCSAMSYIHERYSEEITVADISRQVFLSPSYFLAVFRTLTGYTLKGYLIRYRLHIAATQLISTDKRIVDIAVDGGFSTQQAFAKSFIQQYGVTPARFRKARCKVYDFPPKNLFAWRSRVMELKNIFKNVTYVKKDAFYVIGIETDINYNSSNGTSSIGNLYKRWGSESCMSTLPDQINDYLYYGMTFEETQDDTAKYMVATEVSTLSNIPSGFVGRRFEASEYAVFDCTLEDETNGSFFQYFFGPFLKENNMSQPDAVTTKSGVTYSRYPLFEVYDRDFKHETDRIKIFAPIIRN